jgi:uncharacterized protein YebE (UPF0316 family)
MNNVEVYAWIILPLLIFLARVADVTLGTLRIIFVSRGKRRLAPVLGFFEVLIWVIAIGQLVQNLGSPTSYFGYAAGFAAGNFVGMLIEDRLAIGTLIVRAIIPVGGDEVMQRLHDAGFGVTGVDGHGSSGPVKLVYVVVKRKHIKHVTSLIHSVYPKAFLTIEDVRSTEEGIFPSKQFQNGRRLMQRKTK